MNNDQIKRVLNLVKKTGNKVVVFDSELDDFYVISQIEDNQIEANDIHKAKDLTEDALLAKINRDMADANECDGSWWEKEEQRIKQNLMEFEEKEAEANEDEYYLEPVE